MSGAALLLYLSDVAASVKFVIALGCVISSITILIMMVHDNLNSRAGIVAKYTFPLMVIAAAVMLAAFIPSQATLRQMVAWEMQGKECAQ